MYVGSGTTNRIPNRFHKHLFGGSGSVQVANAVAKYGLDQFAFILLDTVPEVKSASDNASLLALENHYIQLLSPSYNVLPEAGNSYGYRHTDETRAQMSLNYSDVRKETIGSLNRGKQLSAITIERMTASALTRLSMTDGTKALVSLNSAKAELYEVSLADGSLLSNGAPNIVLRTIRVVAEYIGCGEKTVRRAASNNTVVKRKWVIKKLGKVNQQS